jgi:hypothetical protein
MPRTLDRYNLESTSGYFLVTSLNSFSMVAFNLYSVNSIHGFITMAQYVTDFTECFIFHWRFGRYPWILWLFHLSFFVVCFFSLYMKCWREAMLPDWTPILPFQPFHGECMFQPSVSLCTGHEYEDMWISLDLWIGCHLYFHSCHIPTDFNFCTLKMGMTNLTIFQNNSSNTTHGGD